MNYKPRYIGFLFSSLFFSLLVPFFGYSEEIQSLEDYWQRPVPLPAHPPEGSGLEEFSSLLDTFSPSACGGCHEKQFEGWRASFHANAYSPGLEGQLLTYRKAGDSQTEASCKTCHTPLSLQQRVLPYSDRENPDFNEAREKEGLICAGCHIRNWKWYGPPSLKGTEPNATELPHGGFNVRSFFEESEFCGACHQFKKGWLSLNGKPLENTLEEWKASTYPSEGISCQKCHMPKRAHLWRGIHDKKMTQKALSISTSVMKKSDTQTLIVSLTNSGAGHAFPTYVTPMVVVQVTPFDKVGKRIETGVQKEFIQRKIILGYESKEVSDTRIMPQEKRVYNFTFPKETASVLVQITVYPDEYYREMYESILQGDSYQGEARRLIAEALKKAEASPFVMYEKMLSLGSSEL